MIKERGNELWRRKKRYVREPVVRIVVEIAVGQNREMTRESGVLEIVHIIILMKAQRDAVDILQENSLPV